MQTTRPGAIALLLCTLAAPVAGQGTPYVTHCPPGNVGEPLPNDDRIAHDACVKAIDLFRYVAPQLGTAVAGGNAILGAGGPLGGFGHVSIGLRVNAVAGHLPRADRVALSASGAVPTNFETSGQVVPLPAADFALGVWGGIPLGLTNVGGLDLLVSAAYLPSFSGNNVRVKAPGSLRLGFGGRLGIIQESFLLPGVAVSVLSRNLPTVDVIAETQGDTASVLGFDVRTTAWRLTAGKSFLIFGLAVGAGQDRYTFETDARVSVQPPVGDRVVQTLNDVQDAAHEGVSLRRLRRTSYFADVFVTMPFFRLIGEIGQVSGGDIPTFNQFPGAAADKSRFYGSIGARFGW